MPRVLQKSLKYKVLKNIKDNHLVKKGDRIVVALSGGADSVCLFNILLNIKDLLGIEILACHYNHRMRGEDSKNDESFVRKICKARGVDCYFGITNEKILLKNEEEARDARYSFFEKILEEGKGDLVATAHTANDNAETLLLRLIRGTGLSGLRSIPLQRKNFIRPLLSSSRFEIEDYLRTKGLLYMTDESNLDTKYSRNFIRHKVLPLLQELNPSVVSTLSNSATLIEDDINLLNLLTQESFQTVVEAENSDEITLNRQKWLLLSPVLRRTSLRYAISKKTSLIDISKTQIAEVCKLIEKGEGNKFKSLPHSLRLSLKSGKIIISIQNS